MQEDIVGTLRTLGHDAETCSLCGQPYPAQALSPIEAELEDGVLSEREEVCPECGRVLDLGDDPTFPLDEERSPLPIQ
jgi:hypothetical protein